MADKKPKIKDDPFAPTTTQPQQEGEQSTRFDLDKGPTVATGLGIRTGENEAITTVAKELGITKNALMRFALRHVVIEYEAGRLDLRSLIDIPPEPKKTIRLPK